MATVKVIKTTFKIRRGLSTTWAKNNPILAYGEPGFERDTYKLKVGDGEKAWKDLPYIAGDTKEIINTLNANAEKGYVYTIDEAGNMTVVADKTESINIDTIQDLFE